MRIVVIKGTRYGKEIWAGLDWTGLEPSFYGHDHWFSVRFCLSTLEVFVSCSGSWLGTIIPSLEAVLENRRSM